MLKLSSTAQSGKQIVRNRTRPRAKQREAERTHQGAQGTTTPRGRPSASRGSASGLPMLRTSERGTFKRCRWKWWLEFHEQVKPAVDVPPLRFGTLIHSALAQYYKVGVRRGPRPHLTFEKLYDRELEEVGNYNEYTPSDLDDRWAEHRDLGYVMLERYYNKYHPDDEWKVLATEWPFQIAVQHPVRKTPWFWYVGILDGVWKNRRDGRKVIPDHKTTDSIMTQYLSMDPQATAYWTFGVDALIRHGILAPNGSERLDGMLFNFLRKAKRDPRPQDSDGYYLNQDGSVSKRQPAAYHLREPIWRGWSEREKLRTSVLAEFMDMEAVSKAPKYNDDGISVLAYKNAGRFTCTGCWALDICELHEINADWREMLKHTTQTWQPYSEHEIREGR